jgi:hypothetical protein
MNQNGTLVVYYYPVTRIEIQSRADHLTRCSSTADQHAFQVLAVEVLRHYPNPDDRASFISMIKGRLSGLIGDRRARLHNFFLAFGMEMSDDLSRRILSAVSSSNVALFIEELELVHRNMILDAAPRSSSTADSELSARAGSGPAEIQGTPFGNASTSSGEPASYDAVAVTRGPDPDMPRLRAGGNGQDADAVNPTLTRQVANRDLEATAAAAAAAADQTQAVSDAAAKPASQDDPAPEYPRKRESDSDDDRKPPAKRS